MNLLTVSMVISPVVGLIAVLISIIMMIISVRQVKQNNHNIMLQKPLYYCIVMVIFNTTQQ